MKKASGVKRERKGKKHVDEPASAAFAVKLKGARQTMPLQPRRTNTFSKKRITDTAGTVKGGPGWDRWDIWRKHFNIFQQYSRRLCVDMSCTRCKTGSQNLPKTRLTIQLRMVSACLSMSQQYPKLVVAVRLLLSMPSQSPVTRTYCSMAYMRTAPRGPKLSQVMQVPL